MKIFALHNGYCFGDDNLDGYDKYSSSTNCKLGKGGPDANNVYKITNPRSPQPDPKSPQPDPITLPGQGE